MHLDLRAGDRMFWFTTTGWMMWNFLVGCLLSDAAIVLYDGSPAHPDLGALWRLAERARITCMGVSAGPAGELREGRRRAAPRLRPARAARDRLDRLAAGAGELQVGLRARRRGDLAVLDQRRHRRVHGVRRRLPAAAGLRRRTAVPRARLRGGVLGRAGPRARRSRGRAGDHRADAVDAAVLLGRRGRRAPARELLRDVSRRVAPRRLDPHHAARRRRHLRPLGLDDQPPGRAHGHERDLPRGERRAAGARRAGRRHPGAPGRGGAAHGAVRRARRRASSSTTS